MAVPWAKVVILLPKDWRIRRVGPMGELLYIRCLLLAKECMSNGVIDEPQLDLAAVGIPSPRKLADKLVEVGLWEKIDTGWRVPPQKWAKYQTTKEQVEAKRSKRSEAGKKGADARWHNGKPDGNLPSSAHGNAISVGMPPETRDQIGEDKSSPGGSFQKTINGKRNEPLDALVAIDGTDPIKATSPAFSAAGKALQTIREVTAGVTAAEIRRRAENYRLHMKDAILSPFALAKHWALCEQRPGSKQSPDDEARRLRIKEQQRIETAKARGEI